MSLENAQFIHQLNSSNPAGSDRLKDGDDHLRMIKAALLNTFPGIKGPLDATVTHTLLNSVASLLVPIGCIVMWSGKDSEVPSGWAICDGRTVTSSDGSRTFATPNLTDRVPVGVNAAASRAVGSTFGASAVSAVTDQNGGHSHTASTSSSGAHSHGGGTGVTALSIDQMPSHNHHVLTLSDSSNPINNAPESPVAHHSTYGSATQAILTTGGGQWAGLSESKGGGQGHSHSIGSDGAHTHPVTVDAAGVHTHSVSLDVTQPSIALYFIMKV